MRVSVTCPTIYTCQAESVFRTRLEYTAMKAIYRFDDTKSVETVKNNSLRRSRTRGRMHVSSTRVSTMFVTYIVFERRPSRSYSSVFKVSHDKHNSRRILSMWTGNIYHTSQERETISFRIVFVLVQTRPGV